ncbi:MAG TPA: class I SAM-dependent methyltransferase [Solirubrobacterales bacterium]|nr:class I SAM-dependent methyltransferase [Solirubrobacterales bacterium]
MAGEGRPRWAEIAYEAIAPVYDEFTHENDYETWFGLLLPELERHGLRTGRLLDVGCGSGKSFAPMLARGWSIVGCDVSAAMLKRGREKVGDSVRLEVADMRELPTYGEFELVWALNDPVNYMLDEQELDLALDGMRRNLSPDGLLMFDANTILTYRGFFAEQIEFERDGWRMIWRGRSSAEIEPGAVSEAEFEAVPLEEGVGEPITPELHRERHFPLEQILAALERSGLECLDVFGYGVDEAMHQPLDEDEHYKAIYIARAV